MKLEKYLEGEVTGKSRRRTMCAACIFLMVEIKEHKEIENIKNEIINAENKEIEEDAEREDKEIFSSSRDEIKNTGNQEVKDHKEYKRSNNIDDDVLIENMRTQETGENTKIIKQHDKITPSLP